MSGMEANNDDDNEDMWTQIPANASTTKNKKNDDSSLYHNLRDLESSLRCSICYDFYNIPVSIQPCQHTFCSECIRKAFQSMLKQATTQRHKVFCPQCKGVIDTSKDAGIEFRKCLVPNLSLANLCAKFRALRDDLKETLTRQYAACHGDGKMSKPNDGDQDQHNDNTDDDLTEDADYRPQMQTRSSTALASHTSTTEELHDEGNSSQVLLRTKLRPMVRVHYGAMNKKKLRALCEKYHLSTAGTERELRDRHEQFVLLYNSRLDQNSASTSIDEVEIAQEVGRREDARRREEKKIDSSHVACMEQLKANRKKIGENGAANGVPLTSGNPEFDATMNENYKRMIAALKNRTHQQRTDTDPQHKGNSEQNPGTLDPNCSNTINEKDGAGGNSMQPSSDCSRQGKENRKGVTVRKDLTQRSTEHEAGMAHTEIGEQKGIPRNPSLDEAVDKYNKAEGSDTHVKCPSEPTSSDTTTLCTKRKRMSTEKEVASTLNSSGEKRRADNNRRRVSSPAPSAIPTVRTTKNSRHGIVGPWSCPTCTFFNQRNTWSTARCEMCESPRSGKATPFTEPTLEQATLTIED